MASADMIQYYNGYQPGVSCQVCRGRLLYGMYGMYVCYVHVHRRDGEAGTMTMTMINLRGPRRRGAGKRLVTIDYRL